MKNSILLMLSLKYEYFIKALPLLLRYELTREGLPLVPASSSTQNW